MASKVVALPLFDIMHMGMMLAALALSYYLPFELVLLSYAVLGPLHYLTEISWLHERSYFMSQRRFAWLLVICTFLLVVLQPHRVLGGLILYSALTISIAFALFKTWRARFIVIATGCITGFLITRVAPVNVPLVIMLPTVIHVSLFTFLFMLLGALKSRSIPQMLLVVFYVLCIVALFIMPPSETIRAPELAAYGPRYFGTIGLAFGTVFGQNAWPFDARLAGFLSFVYTYHYLNWFIKVKTIKWNAIPKLRFFVIAFLGAAATGLYFFNYSLGLLVLVGLSLLHVLLEFPLNVISIRELGGYITRSRPVSL